jgi:hypothetical protein
MQYILSAEEYDALVKIGRDVKHSVNADLQQAYTLAAIHTPAVVDWKDEIEPWGCILDEDSDPVYCDCCPVKDICPYDQKEFSQ